VRVGEATQRAASGAIAFEEAGDQVLKGKSAPAPAFRALRVVANRRGEGRSDLPEPPFVGRDEELRVLKDLITVQGRDPRVRVASITGPGGIGKSRLAWELEKYVDGLVESVYWHRGRSPAYGEGITFWALGEMVRRRAGLAEGDDEAVTRARISTTVAEYVPGDDDRRWVEPALLTLLGIGDAPPGGRDVLFAAWRIFFERIADRGTTVLLFEDLQWADSGLLDFIDHLLEWARTSPILIVTLARPELFDRRPNWGAGTRHFTALALEPLSAGAMRELLEGFVPGLPAHARDTILARADGIPLYAVEMVRSLVAGGRLRQVEGRYEPAGELGDIAIPESLQSLIASRLDSFDAADRSLIQDAAVLGQTFAPTALAAVTGTSSDELEPRLRALVRREILELQVDPRSPERGQYAFVQSLIREVAYGTLSRRDRRARHLAVARYFEGLGDDELAGLLATHYVAAYRASSEGPEADAIAIQARLALRAAASRAAALGAHEQAVAFLRQAIELSAEPAERADLLVLAAFSANSAANHDEAHALAEAGIAAAAGLGPAAMARAQATMGRILIDEHSVREAVTALDAALADLPESGADEARASVLTHLSRALMRANDFRRAVSTADEGLAIAERLNLDELVAENFNNKAASMSNLGHPREAIALMEAAIRIAESGGYLTAQLRAQTNLASVTWRSDPQRSWRVERETYELARRLGNRNMANWAISAAVAGRWQAAQDWDAALAELDEVIASAHGTSDQARMVAVRAFFLVSRGESTDAELAVLRAQSARRSDPSGDAAVHNLLGDRAELAGDYPTAVREYLAASEYEMLRYTYMPAAIRPALLGGDVAAARRIARDMDASAEAEQPVLKAFRVWAWAAIAAVEDNRADAIPGFREASRRFRELGHDLDLARNATDALRFLRPREPEFVRAADEARAILTRVRATWLLNELDATLRSDAGADATRGTAVGAPERRTSDAAATPS
jgi:tetratricopeptide (TPR) repeat protein